MHRMIHPSPEIRFLQGLDSRKETNMAGNIEVREVKTKKELMDFINFPGRFIKMILTGCHH